MQPGYPVSHSILDTRCETGAAKRIRGPYRQETNVKRKTQSRVDFEAPPHGQTTKGMVQVDTHKGPLGCRQHHTRTPSVSTHLRPRPTLTARAFSNRHFWSRARAGSSATRSRAQLAMYMPPQQHALNIASIDCLVSGPKKCTAPARQNSIAGSTAPL